MATILITGANRGLGLELARQYAAAGDTVHACCRSPEDADALRAIADGADGRVTIHPLEVTDQAQIDALGEALADAAIDILLLNAGVYPDKGMGFGSMDPGAWLDAFRVNTIAPLKIAEALVDPVARSERKVIAIMTSLMGSIEDNTSGGSYAYRSSKAAVNMVAKCLSIELRPRGVTCVLLHPGWVQTDMGGGGAPLRAEPSCRGMREVLAKAGPAESGRFFRYDGSECPW